MALFLSLSLVYIQTSYLSKHVISTRRISISHFFNAFFFFLQCTRIPRWNFRYSYLEVKHNLNVTFSLRGVFAWITRLLYCAAQCDVQYATEHIYDNLISSPLYLSEIKSVYSRCVYSHAGRTGSADETLPQFFSRLTFTWQSRAIFP